jgi:hypothetical protein
LSLHCREASKIVEKFSGEWYSKVKWEQGVVTKWEAADFARGAMRKLAEELQAGARPRG